MSTSTEPTPPSTEPTLSDAAAQKESMPTGVKDFFNRIRTGDLGSLRVLILLAIVWIIFQSQEDRFLSATNIVNLSLQITAVALISVGVVLVLLLGEIDLSVGAVSGVTSAIVAVLSVQHGWAPVPAIVAGLVVGLLIGAFQGFISTRFNIPTFVVTLAGLLGWQGLQLKVLGETGTVNLNPGLLTDLAGKFLADSTGWIVAIVCVVLFALGTLRGYQRRLASGLAAPPVALVIIRIAAVAVAAFLFVYVVNRDRGVPVAVLILLGFVSAFDFWTRRTKFGRHIYAVGGNMEAARRAGIAVFRVRVLVFSLASMMAAVGGIMAASRLLAVNQSSGGSDLLLNSIAGPVIAGTSLFGGRGNVWSALLGALVIGSISNGMDLLAYTSATKFMVTGAVLLGAVVLDSAARMGRAASGRV
ncbi:sugar ABC transporter permease [Conexibacter woesei]|uniref:sugar ABC transporter permease n=1 Tax=Conexibacter woesei TaxID=191495 RepID=UPI00040C304D|nr:ABC transporter permease [Conexibacter woesei]